jgi:hypothetical protein
LVLEQPNSGLDLVETFFPNSVSDLDSAETFPKSRNLGLDIDDNVCLLDSQPWLQLVNGRSISLLKDKEIVCPDLSTHKPFEIYQ